VPYVQTTYREQPARWILGQVSTTRRQEADTLIATEQLPFGRGILMDSTGERGSLGASATHFAGITHRDIGVPPEDNDGFALGRAVSVLTAGDIIVQPIAAVNILVPQEFVGNVINLCVERRGVQKNMQFSAGQVSMIWEIPMNEVVMDFFDRLKSVSRGFGSLDYGFLRYAVSSLVKLDILINGERVDALAVIVHRDQAQSRGRQLVEKMQELIPRQMFAVAIQAAIGGQIVARRTVKALRKNVTAKCYGGDVTRKKKLLEKQKAGKKRMKQVGSVEVPKEAFLAALKLDQN